MVGEENENLAGNGRPPEVNNLVDKEDVNLAGDGKPSEVNKKLVQGSEAEEVPGIPEVNQDEAHDTGQVSIAGLSGDEAIKVEKDPGDEVSKKLIKESEAKEVSEVPAAVPAETPSSKHDSTSHSGNDAEEEVRVPEAPPEEAPSNEPVTTTSLSGEEADPKEEKDSEAVQ